MSKSWRTMIDDFILRRVIDLNDHFLPRDREYVRLRAAYREAMDQLTSRLDADQYRLFLEFESAATSMVIKSDELLYRQGVRDGTRFKRLIQKCEE